MTEASSFRILSVRQGQRGESALVAKAYREAEARGWAGAEVEVRRARAGELCRFGIPARTVAVVSRVGEEQRAAAWKALVDCGPLEDSGVRAAVHELALCALAATPRAFDIEDFSPTEGL